MYKIFKKTGLFMIIAAFLLVGSACRDTSSTVSNQGEENAQGSEKQPIDYVSLADELNALIKDDTMTELSEDMIEATYGFAPDMLEGAKIYMSSGSTANEVAVFSCKKEEDTKTIMDILGVRVKSREESYKEYNPKEAEKLKGAIIGSKGNYVILVVVEDYAAAKEILGKY